MERLKLSNKQWFQHYGGIFGFFLIYPTFIVFIYIEFFFNPEPSLNLPFISVSIMILWMLWNQYSRLNFKEIETSLSLEESKEAAKYAIKSLKWELKIEKQRKFEAYNFVDKDIRNKYGEMITIEFRQNSFLITSICKFDTIKPILGFTFGKNKENEDNFMIFYKEYEAYLRS